MPTCLVFTCPSCRQSKIEQIICNAQVCTEIEEVSEKHGVQYRCGYTLSDGQIERYQCENCGFIIRDNMGEPVTTDDELINTLVNNEYMKWSE